MDFGVSSSAIEPCDKGELLTLAVCDKSWGVTSCQNSVFRGPCILRPCQGIGPFEPGTSQWFLRWRSSGHGVRARCNIFLCVGGITACCPGDGCESLALTVSASASGLRGCLRNGTSLCGGAMQFSSVFIACIGVCNVSVYVPGREPWVFTTPLPATSCSTVAHLGSIFSFGRDPRAVLFLVFHGGALCLGFSSVGRIDLICKAMPVRSAEVQLLS